MKKLKINLDFVPSKVFFFIGEDSHNKYIDDNKMGAEWHIKTDGLTTNCGGDNGHIVLISILNTNACVYEIKGLIVHEITHAVDFIMKEHGFVCDEMKAYLSQHLYIKIMKYYDKEMAKNG